MRNVFDAILRAISQLIAQAVVDWIDDIKKVKKELEGLGGGGFLGAAFSAAGFAIGGAAGAAIGGAISGALGLQHGGIVTKPTVAVIGEAGPEAVIPRSKTPEVAAGMGMAGAEPSMTYTFAPQLSVGSLTELDRRRLQRRGFSALQHERWRRGLRVSFGP